MGFSGCRMLVGRGMFCECHGTVRCYFGLLLDFLVNFQVFNLKVKLIEDELEKKYGKIK